MFDLLENGESKTFVLKGTFKPEVLKNHLTALANTLKEKKDDGKRYHLKVEMKQIMK